MGNNSVPKFIFRLSRFPVCRGSVLGRFYCISFMFVCLSAWNNSAPSGRIFMKFDIWEFFWKSVMKVQVSLLKKITGTLHVDLGTCISCSILLRMRNVSDRSCRENQNTHFMFSKSLPQETCKLCDQEKCSRAGQATDNNITVCIPFGISNT